MSGKVLPRHLIRISFPIHEFIVDEEKRTVVVRSDGKGLMKNGSFYQNTYIFLFHYDQNNKIKECYEYFNPYVAGKNFGVLDKIRKLKLFKVHFNAKHRYYSIKIWLTQRALDAGGFRRIFEHFSGFEFFLLLSIFHT